MIWDAVVIRLPCLVLVCVAGFAAVAQAGQPGNVLSLIQQRLTSGAKRPAPPAVRPQASAQIASRVANITDVVIGDQQGVTYLGTAIWREEGLLAWHDGRDDGIWICQLDPDTGELHPANGKGTFIGYAAPFVGDIFLRQFLGLGEFGTNNGPEWGASQQGLNLYLTTVDDAGVYQQSKCELDTFPALELEAVTAGGNVHRFSNLATQSLSDPQARVAYYEVPLDFGKFSPATVVQPPFWKFDELSEPQHPIPLELFSFNGPRWIRNTPSLTTFLKDENETIQVAEFNTETLETKFITTGPEQHNEAEVIVDPDTNLPRFMTCIEDDRAIAVYELIAGEWVKQNVVYPNLAPKFAGRPIVVLAVKPFVLRGELFFFYNAFIGDSFFDVANPVEIYLGSADGTVNQPLTSGPGFTFRLNPQYYIGTQDNKVFLYYYTSLPLRFLVDFGRYHRLSFTID